MNVLEQFLTVLQAQNPAPSKATVKNYKADILKFIRWFEQHYATQFIPSAVSAETITAYKEHVINQPKTENIEKTAVASKTVPSQGLALKSFDRYLSSLRKFFNFLKVSGQITATPFEMLQTQQAAIPTDPWRLHEFKDHLYIFNASDLTIKNYIIDVKQFLSWAEKVLGCDTIHDVSTKNIFSHLSAALVQEYKTRLHQEAGLSPVSINRKLSSLRRFIHWATEEGYIKPSQNITVPTNALTEETPVISAHPFENIEMLTPEKEAPAEEAEVNSSDQKAQVLVDKPMQKSLPIQAIRPLAKIASAPLRLLGKLGGIASLGMEGVIIAPLAVLAAKLHLLQWQALSGSVFTKKATKTSSGLFGSILKSANDHVSHDPLGVIKVQNFKKEFYAPLSLSTASMPTHKKAWHHIRHTRPNWYRKYHQNPIVHYFHFAILIIIMTALGFGMYQSFMNDPALKKASAAPTAPPRILSFQGRLTDISDNPITTAATPLRFAIYNDATASGSALLWEEVNSVSPDQDGIFSILLGQNTTIPQNLFGDNAALWLAITVQQTPELAPRQQIATVPYATNSELLQGMAPITQVGAGTSNVVLALNSSGNLSIGGSATPVFQSTGGSFTIQGTTTVISTTTGSNGNVIIAPDGMGKIDLQKPLQNSTNNNNIASAVGSVEVDDLFSVLATSSGQSAVTINQDGSGPLLSASASGVAKFTVANSGQLTSAAYTTPGGLLYGTAAGLIAQTGAGTATQCLTGGATPSFSDCSSYWNLTNGALYPNNSSVDLLIGATSTASAKFAVLNVNSGTPVASVSSGVSGTGSYLTADGTLSTTNRQTLTIGNSSTYNTTGNVLINPNGTGNVGIGLSNPSNKLHIYQTADQTASKNAIYGQLNYTGTGDLASDYRYIAGNFINNITGSANVNSGFEKFTAVQGTNAFNMTGNPTIQSSYGVYSNLSLSATNENTITTYVGLLSSAYAPSGHTTAITNLNWIQGGFFNNSGTLNITNQKGLYIPAMVAATVNYGIHVAAQTTGSSDYGIAVEAADTQTLWISANANNTTATAGIAFGSSRDTNLYRSATDTLKTDDSFVVGGSTLTLSNYTTNGGILYTNGSGVVAQTAVGTGTQCLLGGTTPTFGNCGIGLWDQQNGLLYASNATVDFAIGGTSTAAAKFAVLNVNSGTPVASISSGVNGTGSYLTADGTLATTNRQTLTIGNSSTYNTTGNVLINPNGTGNVGIGTSSIGAFKLAVNGNIGIGGGPSGTSGLGITFPSHTDDSLRIFGEYSGIESKLVLRAADDAGQDAIVQRLNYWAVGDKEQVNTQWLGMRVYDVINAGGQNYASLVPYNRFGGNGTTHSLATSSALLVSGLFEVDDNSFFDGTSNSFSGNVGIGTAATTNRLEVLGNTYFNGQVIQNSNFNIGVDQPTTSFYVSRDGGTTQAGQLWTSDDRFIIQSHQDETAESGAYGGMKFVIDDDNVFANSQADFFFTKKSGSDSALFWIGAAGNVGVGTANPRAAFDVVGSASLSGNLSFRGASTAHTVNILDGGTLNFQRSVGGDTGVASSVFIQQNGYVGINTTSPLQQFTVNGSAGILSSLGVGQYADANKGQLVVAGSLAHKPAASLSATSSFAGLVIDNSGTGDIFTASSSGLTRFTLTNAGNVGIGLTNPTEKLDVTGNFKLSGTTTFNSLTYTWPGSQSSGYILQTNGSGTLSWVDPAVAAGGTNLWNSENGALYPKIVTQDLLIGGVSTAAAKFAVLNVNSGTPVASVSSGVSGIGAYLTADGTLATSKRQTLTIGNSSTYNTTGNVLINPNGTGNVGIGTSAPGAKLDIVGGYLTLDNGDFPAGRGLRFRNSTDTTTPTGGGVYQASNNTLYLQAGSSNNTIVRDGSGNDLAFFLGGLQRVGIGASTLQSTFGVQGLSGTIPAASISARSNSSVGMVVDNLGTGDIFTASASGLTRFVIKNNGDIGIGITNPAEKLDVVGNLKISGTTTFNAITYTWPGSQSSGYVLSTDGSGTLSWIDSTSVTGINYWNSSNGALYPKIVTQDLLIGAASTAAAKFAVLNVNSGTPVASVSSGVSGTGSYLTADGTLGTTRRQTLTIGNSSTYDTTGNVLINPNGNGLVGIGTTNPTAKLQVTGGNIRLDNNAILQFLDTGGNARPLVQMTSADMQTFGTTNNNATFQGFRVNFIAALSAGQGGDSAFNLSSSVDLGASDELFQIADSAGTFLTVLGNGNVGIGTTTPTTFTLQVAGSIGPNADNTYDLGASPSGRFRSVYTGPGSLHVICTTGDGCGQTVDYELGVLSSGGNKNTFIIGANGNSTNRNPLVAITEGGNVGIGVINPAEKLDVVGNFKLSGTTTLNSLTYTWPGSLTNGYILQTNGSGTLSWADPTVVAGASNPWNTGNGTIYPKIVTQDLLIGGVSTASANFAVLNNNSGIPVSSVSGNLIVMPKLGGGGNVGIGMTNPTRRLSVQSVGANTRPLGIYGSDGVSNLFEFINNDSTGDAIFDLYYNAQSGSNTIGTRISADSGFSSYFNTGNVGIGLTNPGAVLHVYTNTNGNGILNESGSSASSRIDWKNAAKQYAWVLGTGATNDTNFGLYDVSNTSYRMLVDTNGNIGLSTTLPLGNLHVNGLNNTQAAGIFNTNMSNDILTASASGATKFVVKNDGNVGIGTALPGANLEIAATANNSVIINRAANTIRRIVFQSGSTFRWGLQVDSDTESGSDVGSTFMIKRYSDGGVELGIPFAINRASGNIGIGITNPAEKLDVSGNLKISGTTTLNSLTYTWPGSQSSGYILQTNGSGTLSWVDPAAISSTNFWNSANGTLYPKIVTQDLLIGGVSTISANFAVLNNNSGIPVASVSGNFIVMPKLGGGGNIGIGTSTPGTALTIAPRAAYTSPTLGTATGGFSLLGDNSLYGLYAGVSNTGNTWLQGMRNDGTTSVYALLFNPSGGNVGVGTTTPLATLDIRGYRHTVAAASISAQSNSFAGMVVDNAGTGDIFTASSSGLTRFVIKNNGNVGVGTTNPSSALLQVGNAAGTGSIATSVYYDVDSTAYYLDPAATGNSMTVAGNVGIGTTNPTSKLDIVSSATTTDVVNIAAASLTSGNALTITGPTGGSPGVTDHFVKITSDVACNGCALMSLTADFDNTGSAVNNYGILNQVTDQTSVGNALFGERTSVTLSGNAAKQGYGNYVSVSSSSTTADTLYGGVFTVANTANAAKTGLVGLHGTATTNATSANNTLYGGIFQPSTTGILTGSTRHDVYGAIGQGIANGASTGGIISLRGFYANPHSTNFAPGTGNTTISEIMGMYVTGTNQAASDCTTNCSIYSYGIYIDNMNTSTNGTSIQYGLYLGSQSGSDTNYQFYSAGTAKSYFGGNVGIGTTAPLALMDLGGSVGNTKLALYNDGSNQYGLGIQANEFRFHGYSSSSNFRFYDDEAGTNPLMTIMGSGNVGIGITAPNAKLDIDSGSNTFGLRLRGTSETTEIADMYLDSNGALYFSTKAGADTHQYFNFLGESSLYGTLIWDSSGAAQTAYANLYMNDATTDYLNMVINNSNAGTGLVLDANGNVGIGTTGPGYKLHAYHNGSSSHYNLATFQNAGATTGQLISIAVGRNVNTYDAGYLMYVPDTGTNTNSYMALLNHGDSQGSGSLNVRAGGNVGIGTATPAHKLSVAGTGLFTGTTVVSSTGTTTSPAGVFGVRNDVATGYAAGFQNAGNNANRRGVAIWTGENDGNQTSSNTYWLDFLSGDGSTRVGSVEAVNGATQVQYNTSSDRRMKHDIVNTNYGLTDLMAIQVRDYKWNNGDGSVHPGFIAQELYTVYPDAVSVGGTDDDMTKTWGVDYGRLTPLIIKGVQDLNIKVDANQEQVGNLNLTSTGNIAIAQTPGPVRFQITKEGNLFTQIAALSDAVIANLRVGAIDAQSLTISGQTLQDYIIAVVQNAGFSNGNSALIAPIAQVDRVYTNTITPLANTGKVNVDANLEVNGNISANNATISGTLTATKVESEDGIFNGTLRARNIVADNIQGLQATIATLAAHTITNITNVYQSTPSGSSIYASEDATHSALLAALATLPNGQMATYSGTLENVTRVAAEFGQFNQGLMALGPSSFTDVAVSGQFSVGGSMIFENNSINTLGSELNIQPLRQGGISIMAGLIHIDTDGNTSFGGDVTFAKDARFNGKIIGKIISPIPDEDLVIALGTDALPTTSQFKIKNSSGSAVLAVNQNGDLTASGSGTFTKLNLSLVKQAVATGAGDLLTFGTAGVATISATRSEITIHNAQVTKDSLIYITPVGTASAQGTYLLRQTPGQSFTVGGGAGAIFNWLIVN